MQTTSKALKQDGFKHPEETDSITEMPRFNEVIKIEMSVDTLYDRLLELLPENYKHREVLAHAIIGSSVIAGNIGYISNALFGFTNDIDFKEGNIINCTAKERKERYDANKEKEDGTPKEFETSHDTENYNPKWAIRRVPIGRCEIVKINLYSRDKLVVRFKNANSYSDNLETCEESVNQAQCTIVPYPEVTSH